MKKTTAFAILTLPIISLVSLNAWSRILYVDRNASGTRDGSSWEDAFTILNGAMTMAPMTMAALLRERPTAATIVDKTTMARKTRVMPAFSLRSA